MKLVQLNLPLATVYGSLMHHRAELSALGEAVHQPPYNAAPQAPVLYIKPANTFSAVDARIALPAGQTQLRARACLGLFFKQKWHIAGIESAQSAIESIVNNTVEIALLCDFTVPHNSFHRPPVKFNSFDGSLGLPAQCVDAVSIDLKNLQIETWVNGVCHSSYNSADWLCSAQEQWQAAREFIAFEAGDVLMMGCPPDAPLVYAGDVVEARMQGYTFTRNQLTEATV
jgi:5-oxopent-3-ene-1,2,5-tricarboxylate decarboxylase / 2-hydroxyhepta-2,4-diene-1,7-dioate isomerase